MLGPAAVQQQPHSLSGLRTCLLVGLVSGLWCQALCVSLHVQTHTHTHPFNALQRSRHAHFTRFAPMAHHHNIFSPHSVVFIMLFHKTHSHPPPPPHTCVHAFLFHITELFLMIAKYRVCCVFLNITRSMIDVYGNEEVTSSKEIPYGWEQHTDERHLQKALVNSWHA